MKIEDLSLPKITDKMREDFPRLINPDGWSQEAVDFFCLLRNQLPQLIAVQDAGYPEVSDDVAIYRGDRYLGVAYWSGERWRALGDDELEDVVGGTHWLEILT